MEPVNAAIIILVEVLVRTKEGAHSRFNRRSVPYMTETLRGPGSTIGAYEILDEIGRGGLGVVYRSRHRHLGRLAALKVLHPLWTASPEFVERFREEGRLMALLEHPNILRVYDAGEDSGLFFLATAYHDGQTLEAAMQQPVPMEVALYLVRQVARALAYAHRQGIVHRDVKPANVMVSAENRVTLMDFGVARLKDAPGMTLPGIRVGTPYYMAPEQILGKRVDGRVDVYALGVILHQLLSGQLPFPGPTTEEVFEGHVHRDAPELDPRLPQWLRDASRKALAKDPEHRFPDAETMFRALDPAATRPSIPAPEVIPAPPAPVAAAPTPASTASATGPRSGPFVREHRTALSLDVVGSARMKHPGLTQVIQEQFALFRTFVRRLLEKHGCVDSVWSGDGLLALFASPADGAACGVAILEGLSDPSNAGAAPIHVRLGIHHGPVLMAEGTPLGEVMSRTLDTAGHLQKSCPEDSVLVSESVFFGLQDHANWGPAPPQFLLAFPFPVYQYRPGAGAAVEAGKALLLNGLRLEVASKGQSRTIDVTGEALIGRPDPASRRVPEVDLRTDDAVSRRHARIFRGDGGFFVEDLGSANGTSLNGRWLEASKPVALQPGDQVEVGEETVIRVFPAGK